MGARMSFQSKFGWDPDSQEKYNFLLQYLPDEIVQHHYYSIGIGQWLERNLTVGTACAQLRRRFYAKELLISSMSSKLKFSLEERLGQSGALSRKRNSYHCHVHFLRLWKIE